ncbi:28S ribosomal protein S23, mitochondrial [Lampris incognitus]|uniref:28S ribosomal protein S23, mitochondrial n=1 Tax=Lampris incognitus TaxID=2546036 RepID=UPI0024B51AAB|nr:28S ribosomal protein S23, mitochondrial [Lampris incognitus]
MAGSRLEKFGSVFTRTRDVMRSGVTRSSDKCIWYDIYKTFPPKRDPVYVKPHSRTFTKKEDPVPDIFYREDEIRAKFYEAYGTGQRAIDLSKSNLTSTCQRFVEKYAELESKEVLDEATLFEETGKALLTEGVMLRRRVGPMVSPESRDPVLELKLTDMLAEQQSVSSVDSQKLELPA